MTNEEKQSQQKRIDRWATMPIADLSAATKLLSLEPGCEVSTWDRKTKTGVTGVVLGGEEKPQGVMIQLATRNGKIHSVPFSDLRMVTKSRRDVEMIFSKDKK